MGLASKWTNNTHNNLKKKTLDGSKTKQIQMAKG
jgi:hypothetical protein